MLINWWYCWLIHRSYFQNLFETSEQFKILSTHMVNIDVSHLSERVLRDLQTTLPVSKSCASQEKNKKGEKGWKEKQSENNREREVPEKKGAETKNWRGKRGNEWWRQKTEVGPRTNSRASLFLEVGSKPQMGGDLLRSHLTRALSNIGLSCVDHLIS